MALLQAKDFKKLIIENKETYPKGDSVCLFIKIVDNKLITYDQFVAVHYDEFDRVRTGKIHGTMHTTPFEGLDNSYYTELKIDDAFGQFLLMQKNL